MKTLFLGTACLLTVLAAGLCLAYPTPAIVPAPHEWTLNVLYGQPKQITVEIPTKNRGRVKGRFWYIILTLTNNAGSDADFYPVCDLMTDTFKITPAGKNIRKLVFDKIKLLNQGSYPFLEPVEYIDNKILEGQDNAKDIAIIWPDFDPRAKNIDLFISGLSNEVAVIDHPVKTDENGKPLKVYLRKTLNLRYSIGGDQKLRATAKLRFKEKNWVMR